MKPLLAATLEDVNSITYPVIASPKLDGVRCLIKDGKALSRSLKPIPNKHVQSIIAEYNHKLDGLDGELLIGAHDETVFRRTTSGVMSIEGEPDFVYCVFDAWGSVGDYRRRLSCIRELFHSLNNGHPCSQVGPLKIVASKTINNSETLLQYETECLARGYEGVMIRDPNGEYKHGRSTLKEGILLKLKRFVDNEAIIIGFEELMHNENEATLDELGYTERSTSRAGLVPAGMLGALLVRSQDGINFKIGSGFDAKQRKQMWKQRKKLLGQFVTYKSFPMGGKDKPRFPIFKGIRHPEDM